MKRISIDGLTNDALMLRQQCVEKGQDEQYRYYTGVLDGLRTAGESMAWRNPVSDPPALTGKIIVWIRGVGPAIVNVEERWTCFWDGNDEAGPTDPTEWDAWREIDPPKESSK